MVDFFSFSSSLWVIHRASSAIFFCVCKIAIYFLIQLSKHVFWVLKRTVSSGSTLEDPFLYNWKIVDGM